MLNTKIHAFFIRRKKYIVLFSIIALCTIMQIVFRHNTTVADFMTFGLSGYLRGIIAAVTSILPFSLGETVVVMLPLLLIVVLIKAFSTKGTNDRLLYVLLVILTVIYALFVLTFSSSYGTSKADELFDIEASPVGRDELYEAALILTDEINSLCDDIDFDYASFSNMNYDLDELGEKLVAAYDSLGEEYGFLLNFKSRLKPIALSEPMTYTHISGVYTYYTGEANINMNYPDYTLPYTSAHEMAHQRGFAREKEANFVAFLVCESSNDAYVKYSGKLNMLEYILSALCKESYELYLDVFYSLDIRVRCEMASYSEFFDKYSGSTASEIAGAINDTYLKSNGQSDGEKSYGLVVDLALSYILSGRK